MTLVDSSVWLALVHVNHEFHGVAETWMVAQKHAQALFCRATQNSLLRLLTTEAISRRYGVATPTNRVAWKIYESFVADWRVGWAEEPKGVDSIWRRFSEHPASSPRLWMDAYLAAFAVAGGYSFVTFDSGFQQFDNLKVHVLSAG